MQLLHGMLYLCSLLVAEATSSQNQDYDVKSLSDTEISVHAEYQDFLARVVRILRHTKKVVGYEKKVTLKLLSTKGALNHSAFLDRRGAIVLAADLSTLLMDDEELTGVLIHEMIHKKHRKQFFNVMRAVLERLVGTPYLNPSFDSIAFAYSKSFAEYYVVQKRAYRLDNRATERILRKSCVSIESQLSSVTAFFRCLVAVSVLEGVESIPFIQEIAKDWRAGRFSKQHLRGIRAKLREKQILYSTEVLV
ncbi:MAG: hypothetical protein EAX81_03700 [Candidatus Thorarchaeota archaeon]|nr:hypothetical protein [Candidatus Thorarchaeota archaeon]